MMMETQETTGKAKKVIHIYSLYRYTAHFYRGGNKPDLEEIIRNNTHSTKQIRGACPQFAYYRVELVLHLVSKGISYVHSPFILSRVFAI